MATLDGELRAIAARGSRATVTPDGLLSSVTARAARRRATALAGASLSALAAIGLAATAAISLGRSEPPATPPDKVLGTVTLPFDPAPSVDIAELPNALGLACGDPAPTPVTSAAGLEWSPPSGSGTTFDPTHFPATKMTLRNTAGDTLPAAVSSTGYVIVQDGVVAGWTDGDWSFGTNAPPTYRYLDSSSANIIGGQFVGASLVCPENAAQEQVLALGDYQVYPVIHVSASPADAARQWLSLEGYVVPTDHPADLAILTPGSWDCTDPAGVGADGQVPSAGRSLLCAPETPAGVTLDREARTVTVPYTSRLYERSLDVTLVGEPLSYTNSTLLDASSFLGYPGFAAAPIPETSALGCGVLLDDGAVAATGRTSAVVEEAVLDFPARTRFDSETSIDLAFMPQVLSARGTVAYPTPMRVWFLAHPSDYAADAIITEPSYVVVGTATATVNRGEPVAVDRFAGPSATSVAFTDVRWCDEDASWANALIVFEGTERVDDGSGARESTILDAWATDVSSWLLYGGD